MTTPDAPSPLARASRVLDAIEEYGLTALLATIVAVSFVDVIVRALNMPFSRVQQILPNLFVWLVWLGIPYGIRKGEHFRAHVLGESLRRRARRVLATISLVAAATFFALTVWFGIVAVAIDIKYGQTMPSGFHASFIDAAAPTGSMLALVRLVQGLVGPSPDSDVPAADDAETAPETPAEVPPS